MIIIGHLEIFIHKKVHIFPRYHLFLAGHFVCSFYSYSGFGKRLCRECLYALHISVRPHVFWMYFGPILDMMITLDIPILSCPKYVLWIF